jgi:multiple antibiotic resistance protein
MSLTQDLSNIEIILGIILNAIMIYIFLKTAPWIQNKLGVVGITIMERVFGILLVAIGMKILINSLVLSVVAAQSAIG